MKEKYYQIYAKEYYNRSAFVCLINAVYYP